MNWLRFITKIKNPISYSSNTHNNYYDYNTKKLFLSHPIPTYSISSNTNINELFEKLFQLLDKDFNVYKTCETLIFDYDYNYFPSNINNFVVLKNFELRGKNYNKFNFSMLPTTVEHINLTNTNLYGKTFLNSEKLINLKILEMNLHQVINHKSIMTYGKNILLNNYFIPLDNLKKLDKIILHFEYYFIDGEKVFRKWIEHITNSIIFSKISHRFNEIKLSKKNDIIYSQYLEIILCKS